MSERLGRRERAATRGAYATRSDQVADNLNSPVEPAYRYALARGTYNGSTSPRFRDPVGNIFKGGVTVKR